MAALVRSDITFLPMPVGRFLKEKATRCRRPSFSPITSYASLRPSGGEGATMPGRAMEQCSAH
jgi:hypothetical protein